MITVSYKDFISNSGNIQLDKIEDKLRNLFLVDSKIKLKEVDKIYTIDNINDFIRDISLFLKDEQKCSEENNQDIKQSLQVEQSIAVEQEDDSEYNVYRTWWGKTFAIFVVVWLISMFTSHDWGTKDFSKKYSFIRFILYRFLSVSLPIEFQELCQIPLRRQNWKSSVSVSQEPSLLLFYTAYIIPCCIWISMSIYLLQPDSLSASPATSS